MCYQMDMGCVCDLSCFSLMDQESMYLTSDVSSMENTYMLIR